MDSVTSCIAANHARVVERIEAACRRAGRAASEVRLVAVTKSAEVAWIEALVALGVRDLAESRPQKLCERAALVDPSVRWHLIGQLQRNKVRKVLPIAGWIHSVDSLPLLWRINEIAAELGVRPRVLLEINVSGEAAKSGFPSRELYKVLPEFAAVKNVDVAGLMTMAPLFDALEAARPVFALLREIREQITIRELDLKLPELSMGMSGDFEVAVEEGATMVRVGTSLFEGLAGGDD
jgi:PLP dependent protein